MAKESIYRRYSKRLFDLVLTITVLALIASVMAFIALLVRSKLGSPVLFCQQRPGLHGKAFTIYKYRTMTDARDAYGNLLSDSERLTHLGKFLRSTSLDELPELWNVIKGDMSLVGPRPLLMEYLSYYTVREQKRHLVKPGITGLSQVNGRNHLQWDERLELDVQYVEAISLRYDVKILLETIRQVLVQKDVVVVPRTIGQPLSVYRSRINCNE